MNRREGLINTFFCNDLISRCRLGNQSLTHLLRNISGLRDNGFDRIRFPTGK